MLKIGPPCSTNKEGIAGEDTIVHEKAIGIVRVARRVYGLEAKAFDLDQVAIGNADGYDIGFALSAHDRYAFRAIPKGTQARDVIGVNMGVDGLDQLEVEFIKQFQVALHLFQHGVDYQRLSTLPAGKQIGIAERGTVEELPKYHRLALTLRPRIREACAISGRRAGLSRARQPAEFLIANASSRGILEVQPWSSTTLGSESSPPHSTQDRS